MLEQEFVFALVCIICVISASSGTTIKERKEVSDRLLVNYSKHIMPTNLHNKDNPFNIEISFELAAIGGIDEVEEKLSTVLRIKYWWTDESIRWDPEETNVNHITLGWSDVWKPVFHVTNPQTDSSQAQKSDRSYETVIFAPNGVAYFDELVTTRTSCDMDMSYYPFDIQTCKIDMAMIESSKYWFNLTVDISKDHTEHGTWNLISKTSSAKEGSVEIKLVFERYPLFLLLNVVLPLYILALLLPFVFLLPKKSGERVGYSLTMLLAISVYMTIMSNNLPQKSYPAPLLTIMVFIAYLVDAVVVFVVIVSANFDPTTLDKPVLSARAAFVKCRRKCWKCCPKPRNRYSEDTQQNRVEMQTVGNTNEGSEGMHNADNGKEVNVTLKDFLCFLISFIVKVAMPAIFYAVMDEKSKP